VAIEILMLLLLNLWIMASALTIDMMVNMCCSHTQCEKRDWNWSEKKSNNKTHSELNRMNGMNRVTLLLYVRPFVRPSVRSNVNNNINQLKLSRMIGSKNEKRMRRGQAGKGGGGSEAIQSKWERFLFFPSTLFPI